MNSYYCTILLIKVTISNEIKAKFDLPGYNGGLLSIFRWQVPHVIERRADDTEYHAGGRGADLSVQDAPSFDAGNGRQQ